MNNNYFSARGVEETDYSNATIHKYILEHLSADKDLKVLDFGCGLGYMLNAFLNHGYKKENILGLGIDINAINYCQNKGFNVHYCDDLENYASAHSTQKFDIIICSHVLEHLHKPDIIKTLKIIKDSLLNANGKLFIMVPNAQSITGAYWRYEDFTHNTLFTAGSLIYVLRMAGFNDIAILDPQNIADCTKLKRNFRKIFLKIYHRINSFWMFVTSSQFHSQSPVLYGYEIKALAKNN